MLVSSNGQMLCPHFYNKSAAFRYEIQEQEYNIPIE